MKAAPAPDELISAVEMRLERDLEVLAPDAVIVSLISRIRKEQEDKAVMARALDEVCQFLTDSMDYGFMPKSKDNIAFLQRVSAALTGSSTIISDMEAEIAVLRARLKDTEAALFEVSEENDAFKAEAGR